MNKTILAGTMGLATLLSSCSEISIDDNNNQSIVKIEKIKNFQSTDSILKYRTTNNTINIYQDDKKGLHKIELNRKMYYREQTLKTPTLADDSIFIAGEEMWNKYTRLARIQQEDKELISARKATSRIYDAMNFCQK